MVAHRSRDANSTRWTFRLKSCCHIHGVAVQVSSIGNRVANVDSNAEPDGTIRRLASIMDGNLLLYLHSAAHCPIDAIKHDEKRIAPSLDDPAAVLFYRRVYQVAAQSRSRSSVPASSRPIRRL